jgi:lysozyme
MALPNKRSLAAIVGATAAAALYVLTPSMEGRVLKTYKDVGAVLTYCDGATENAIWGKTYTPAECNAQLDRDLARHAEGVMACTSAHLTDGQKVAYVDFAYNVGVVAYCGSSVARKANAGDVRGSCDALMMWNRAGGKVWPGLTRRRAAEREICLRGLP